jgi:hypothetical protein
MAAPADPEISHEAEHNATIETTTEVLNEDEVVDDPPDNTSASPYVLRVSPECPPI